MSGINERRPPPTIDMTLEGEVLDRRPWSTHWTGFRGLRHGLGRGALPATLLLLVTVAFGAVLLLGVALVLLPPLLLVGAVAAVARVLGASRVRQRPAPIRRPFRG